MSSITQKPYTKTAITLHWLVALFILMNLVIGFYMNTFPHNSLKFNSVLFYHASVGSLIFMLVVFRLLWRFTHTPPALPPTVAKWQATVAHMMHFLLYVLMLAIPFSGYVHRLSGGHPVSFFGLGDLPAFLGKDEPRRLLTDTLHISMVFLLIALLFMHIGAALKHRFIDRDGVAERMLPGG